MIARGEDGYYHPASAQDLQDLVKHAHTAGIGVRVRGAAHSVKAAVFNDGYDGEGAPPEGPIEVMLDRMRKVEITENGDGTALAAAEAGCHLGRCPYDPAGTSTWKNSFNYQVMKAGYALDDLGGISHQTVSGFMSTGSAGGSIKHTLADDLVRLQLIDGTGKFHDLSRDDPDPQKRDMFHAAGTSMGLLGVITKMWFRVGPTYNVAGQEVTTRWEDCNIDLTGDGDGDKKGIVQFLRDTPYTRLLWWPQHNFNRVQVWSCGRLEATDDFQADPFLILTKAQSLVGSLLQTLIGNIDDLTKVPDKLDRWYAHLEDDLDGDEDINVCLTPQKGGKVGIDEVLTELENQLRGAIDKSPKLQEGAQHEREHLKELWKHRGDDAPDDQGLSDGLARAITRVVRFALDNALDGFAGKALSYFFAEDMPDLIDNILPLFVQDGTKQFSDAWMCGLPMDNQMDDELWPTEFTELWLPLDKAPEAMKRLVDFFDAGGDTKLSYSRCRSYATELYAAAKSPFWLSPAYGTDVFRVDPFWFSTWAGDPVEFFSPYFDLLEDLDFRPHWGKYLPKPSAKWRAHYRKVLPKLEDFLTVRKQLDPKQIFVTEYWREHLGIVAP